MTNLAHKSGGLLMKGSGLATSCSCCEGPCTVCGGCNLTTYVELDETVQTFPDFGMGYYRVSRLAAAANEDGPPWDGPFHITWNTGYPAALDCYFWWYSEVRCASTTGVYPDPTLDYFGVVRYWRLYQCESGVAVNRTDEAVASASYTYAPNTQHNVESTAYGNAIRELFLTSGNVLNGYCLTEVEDIEPLDPEFVC